jgi:hypothetical protein
MPRLAKGNASEGPQNGASVRDECASFSAFVTDWRDRIQLSFYHPRSGAIIPGNARASGRLVAKSVAAENSSTSDR